jgi:nicotinamide-nucleotide amidase
MWHEVEIGGAVRRLVVLPGVPPEMKVIFRDTVLPRLRSIGGLERIVRQTILTTGIGESNLNEKLGDVTPRLNEALALAFLPGPQGVRLRVTAFPDRDPSALDRMGELVGLIRERAARYVYGEGEMTMEGVVGQLLIGRRQTIAVAESCTGGLVLSRLTDIPGASAYVLGGVVAYDNHVKQSVLDVRPETLERHGAVSRETVVEMAEGVRKRLGADVGLATSGILGPDGGTDEKPVGTVWIAYSTIADLAALKLRLGKDRGINKERAVTAVLDLARRKLSGDSKDEAA